MTIGPFPSGGTARTLGVEEAVGETEVPGVVIARTCFPEQLDRTKSRTRTTEVCRRKDTRPPKVRTTTASSRRRGFLSLSQDFGSRCFGIHRFRRAAGPMTLLALNHSVTSGLQSARLSCTGRPSSFGLSTTDAKAHHCRSPCRPGGHACRYRRCRRRPLSLAGDSSCCRAP
jgi:hypothetical protein